MRNLAGFFLNRRFTCVAECLDRLVRRRRAEGEPLMTPDVVMDVFALTVGRVPALKSVDSGRRNNIMLAIVLVAVSEVRKGRGLPRGGQEMRGLCCKGKQASM